MYEINNIVDTTKSFAQLIEEGFDLDILLEKQVYFTTLPKDKVTKFWARHSFKPNYISRSCLLVQHHLDYFKQGSSSSCIDDTNKHFYNYYPTEVRFATPLECLYLDNGIDDATQINDARTAELLLHNNLQLVDGKISKKNDVIVEEGKIYNIKGVSDSCYCLKVEGNEALFNTFYEGSYYKLSILTLSEIKDNIKPSGVVILDREIYLREVLKGFSISHIKQHLDEIIHLFTKNDMVSIEDLLSNSNTTIVTKGNIYNHPTLGSSLYAIKVTDDKVVFCSFRSYYYIEIVSISDLVGSCCPSSITISKEDELIESILENLSIEFIQTNLVRINEFLSIGNYEGLKEYVKEITQPTNTTSIANIKPQTNLFYEIGNCYRKVIDGINCYYLILYKEDDYLYCSKWYNSKYELVKIHFNNLKGVSICDSYGKIEKVLLKYLPKISLSTYKLYFNSLNEYFKANNVEELEWFLIHITTFNNETTSEPSQTTQVSNFQINKTIKIKTNEKANFKIRAIS